MKKVSTHKNKLAELENRIESLEDINEQDKAQFMELALERAEQMWLHFLQLPKDKLLQCKQLLIPAGFWVDENENVYTPEISVLYRLATNKKDLSESETPFLVAQVVSHWNQICKEILQWSQLIEVWLLSKG